MRRDPIVEEVRRNREAIAREHGNDLGAIVAAFQREDGDQWRHNCVVASEACCDTGDAAEDCQEPTAQHRAGRKPKSRKPTRAARG